MKSSVFNCRSVVGTGLIALSRVTAETDYSCAHANSWFLNENNHKDSFYDVETDVTSSSLVSGKWEVKTNRIPLYDHVMTADDMTFLNDRPKASTDYTNGSPEVSLGDTVVFGHDIGYAGGGPSCDMGTTTFN